VAHSIAIDIARNSALALPPLRRARDRRILAGEYDPAKDEVGYVRSVFEKHAKCVSALRELSGDVLEIGPGGNLGVALLFLDAGADHAVSMDSFPLVSDLDVQQALYGQLVRDPERLLSRLSYRCPDAIETTRLPDESFDIIYSHACLEHVANPAAAAAQIARLLKPGGATSHQIDLRDHRDFGQPLAFLRYSDLVWHAAVSRRGTTNRWRASDWIDAFQSDGLKIADATPTDVVQVTEEDRDAMNSKFHQKTLEDLGVTSVLLSARKPQ
jgi:SAM-dependent methyltransferase